MKKNIAVLPGDGIGPEVIAQAVNTLKAIAQKFGHTFRFEYAEIGGCAIDKYGEPYPAVTHELCMKSDAILFGAIGDPKYDMDPQAKVRPEQGLLKMRKSLGLFANLRPIRPFPALLDRSPLKKERIAGADMMIVRELTGGLYFGEPRGRNESGTTAFDTCIYSKEEISRVAVRAFELAGLRKNHVTLVDKANVLATSRLWRETVKALRDEKYPQIKLDYMFVDNAAMQLVTAPGYFDILLTENLFGDILSDEAGVITGSIGLLPSASAGESVSLYEPIHGSYPQAAGKNTANPVAAILSGAMLLEYSFGMQKEAEAVTDACAKAIENGIVTEDLAAGGKAFSTSEVGEYICKAVMER